MSVLLKQADTKPSALDRRSQYNLNRRSSVARGRCHEVTDEVRPRSGRAVIASFGEVKFLYHGEKVCSGVMLSKMSAFADISPIGDKKSSRTFQRNFSEEKFLSGRTPKRL